MCHQKYSISVCGAFDARKRTIALGKYVEARKCGVLPTHREKRSSLPWIIGIASGEQTTWNSAGREICIKTVLSASSPSLADDSPNMTIAKETGSRGCWASCAVHAGCVCAFACALWAASWLDTEPGK